MDNLKLDAIMMEALKPDPITFGEYPVFVLLLFFLVSLLPLILKNNVCVKISKCNRMRYITNDQFCSKLGLRIRIF